MADLNKLNEIAVDSTPKDILIRKQRKANAAQRKYNTHVALRLLQFIDETPGMNQTKLAKKLEVSSAYLSRVINGKENLSLDKVSEYEYKLEGYSLLPTSQASEPKTEIFDQRHFSIDLPQSHLFKVEATYERNEKNIIFSW